MKKFIKWFLGPDKEFKYIMRCIDNNVDTNISLVELISRLETRIEYLEKENISLTNELYEVENRLQSEIDKIKPPIYNFEKKEKKNEF